MQDKKPTIAYIGQKGAPARWGGVERSAEELAVRMARDGYTVIVYCREWYTQNTPAQYHGVELVYTPSFRTKHLDTISHTFFSLVHALYRRADVIHFQGIGPALLAWIPRLFAPHTKVLVTFHCLDRKLKKWGPLSRLVFWFGEFVTMNCAHEVFVTSRFLQDYCWQVWQRALVYLPNGVFEDSKENISPDILANFGVSAQNYFVAVGRFMQDKAQHETIEAFVRMKDRGGDAVADIKLVFIGDADEGDFYRASLFEQAAGRDDIIFAGNQTGVTLKTLMRFACGAVAPSYSEGMPLAVLELAAFSVPLVLSDIPAHREIFGDAYVYSPVGDIERISRSMEIIARNYDDVSMVARIQATRIAQHYRWEVIAARYNVSVTELISVGIQGFPSQA